MAAKGNRDPNGTNRLFSVYDRTCPSRRVLELISDKWTLLIVPALMEGPRRNGELLRRIDGISQKVLTETLRGLERNGLVERIDFGEVPPRVEYRLSELGRSLASRLALFDEWAESHIETVEAARSAFDAAIKRSGA